MSSATCSTTNVNHLTETESDYISNEISDRVSSARWSTTTVNHQGQRVIILVVEFETQCSVLGPPILSTT